MLITILEKSLYYLGNITVSTLFTLATALPTDLSVCSSNNVDENFLLSYSLFSQLSFSIAKKIAGYYIKVPCIDGFGSCTFDNICIDWAKNCPKYFAQYGFPCTCPIPANTYTIDNGVFDITHKFPPGSSGTYSIIANINSTSADNIVCVKIGADAVIG